MSTTETAPDSCPFCGAGIIIMADGRECRSQNQWVSFQCFTNWHRNYREPRKLQSSICEDGERRRLICERERLTRERDEARAERDQALMLLGVYKTKSGDLLARVKQLEEELESRWLLAQSAIGSCAEMSSRIKRLEEALEACAAIIGPRDKVTWATDEQVDHAWELYTKAKEAKP